MKKTPVRSVRHNTYENTVVVRILAGFVGGFTGEGDVFAYPCVAVFGLAVFFAEVDQARVELVDQISLFD